ncbi:hypothetical protein JIG36_49210 [Actinoplanes sp. LDG1-06]|uniref:SCP2 domain-containing protein n=1 Tax=Paractinoplanes ovalisporus TaxID=2810368 RepID=A0ABS2AUL6_9ACTN|nr:hypothetical protein [Actinoplanes ovalisporus]MBM2623501.1 hypothetical protein [Actinoplanes ovalisporus]
MDHDDKLLADLRRIAGSVDGPPASVLEAARAAFLTRDLDAEIAHLVADSRGPAAFEQVRAAPEDPAQGHWLLSFSGGGVQIDLEVESDAGALRLVGMLSGEPVEECALRTESGSHPVTVDELGRFVVEGLAPGPIRMFCRLAGGRRVTTRWIRI